MPFVLDCSVTMAWLFPDGATVKTDALRDALVRDMAIVPVIWPIEVANVLSVATRRKRISKADWPRIHRSLGALPIEVDHESVDRVFDMVLPMAYSHELSVYDGMYLELAIRLKLPLATLDRDLIRACRAAAVDLI